MLIMEQNVKLQLEVNESTDFFFFLFRAIPVAYGGSQDRGRIRAIAAGLYHSHSNMGSELHL